jgi:hypothetical protein
MGVGTKPDRSSVVSPVPDWVYVIQLYKCTYQLDFIHPEEYNQYRVLRGTGRQQDYSQGHEGIVKQRREAEEHPLRRERLNAERSEKVVK